MGSLEAGKPGSRVAGVSRERGRRLRPSHGGGYVFRPEDPKASLFFMPSLYFVRLSQPANRPMQ